MGKRENTKLGAYTLVTTINSREDIEFMLTWLSDVMSRANLPATKLNKQVEEEIRDCIRNSYDALPPKGT